MGDKVLPIIELITVVQCEVVYLSGVASRKSTIWFRYHSIFVLSSNTFGMLYYCVRNPGLKNCIHFRVILDRAIRYSEGFAGQICPRWVYLL